MTKSPSARHPSRARQAMTLPQLAALATLLVAVGGTAYCLGETRRSECAECEPGETVTLTQRDCPIGWIFLGRSGGLVSCQSPPR